MRIMTPGLGALLLLGLTAAQPQVLQAQVLQAQVPEPPALTGAAHSVSGGGMNGLNGLLGDDQRLKMRDYLVREQRPSFYYEGRLKPGIVLPRRGYPLYDMPAKFGDRGYLYTIIYGQAVVVDPLTHVVVQILN